VHFLIILRVFALSLGQELSMCYNIRKDDGRRKWELSSQHNFVNEDQTTNYSNLNNPAFAFAFCTTPK